MQGLQSLEEKGYIHWGNEPDIQSIVVLKDREDLRQPKKQHSSALDYWTYY